MEEALPLRIGAIHVVNSNWTISLIKRILDPFLPLKLRERVNLLNFFLTMSRLTTLFLI
jgi:hypothetical protein